MEFQFPTYEYMAISAGAAALIFCVIAAILRNNFRVGGPVSWLVLAVFVPVPALISVPATALIALNHQAALPVVGITIALALGWVHIVLPALVPDFQTDGFTASTIGAACIGLAVFIGGAATNSFPEGYLFGTEENVFVDRRAGTLRDVGLE